MGKKTKIHLFLNTGMNREGVQEDQLEEFLKELQKYPNILVELVLSHFFDADVVTDHTMDEQIQRFKRMYYKILDA